MELFIITCILVNNPIKNLFLFQFTKFRSEKSFKIL